MRHAFALLLAGTTLIKPQEASAWMPPLDLPDAVETPAELYQRFFPAPKPFCFAAGFGEDGDLSVISPNTISLDMICDENGNFKPSGTFLVKAVNGRFELPFEEKVFLVMEKGVPFVVWEEKGKKEEVPVEGGRYSLMDVTAAWGLTPLNMNDLQ